MWPLGFLILIPLLILLYILKQKSEEKVMSSTLLWSEVYKNIEATTPWEKLKKNIMLFFQLLALLLLIFALMNPFIKWGGSSYKNLILVIDNSGSMNSLYEGEQRLKRAKDIGSEYIKGLKAGGSITIISCGEAPKVEIATTKDKNLSEEKLKAIKPKGVAGDIKDSLSLVKSIGKQLESYETLIISDKQLELGDINGRVISLGSKGQNGAIDLIAHKNDSKGYKVMMKVTNRGSEDYSSDLSLYGENKLIDVKTISLKPKETTTVYFDVADFKGEYFKGELSEKDDLADDNIAYDVIKGGGSKKILLVTEKNLFLERALSTLDNTEIFKANSLDNVNSQDKYDMYVYDGVMPKELPSQGNVLFINPSDNEWFNIKSEVKGGEGTFIESDLSTHLNNVAFGIESFKPIEVPTWAKAFLKVENSQIAFEGNYKGKEIGVLSFDLHKTDLVLKAEFPILIHNLSSKLLDQGMLAKNNFYAGEEIDIKGNALGGDINIKTPNSGNIKIPLRFPLKPFKEGYESGIYYITQKVADEEKRESFSINFPSREEGDLSEDTQGELDKRDKDLKELKSGLDLSPYLLGLALVLIGLEWYFYKRGY